MLGIDKDFLLTWLCNADTNISTLELRSICVQCLLQAFKTAKFHISKALGFAIHLVFNDANICNFALSEEILNIALCGVERQIAKMSSVRRSSREG